MEEKKKSYRNVLIFFVLELLAFVSFNLANMFVLFSALAFVLLAAMFLLNYENIKRGEGLSFLIFIIPLILYVVLNMFSVFNRENYGIFNNLLVGIGLLAFVSIGYLTRYVKGFKIIHALTVVYGGLAVLLAISFIYSMVRYVPFYTILYNGQYIYYEGSRTTVYDSIKFLMGFDFQDVSIQYFSIFSTMLFTSVIGLRFLKFKENRKLYYLYIAYSLLGFICLLFTINKYRLISDVLVLISILLIMFVPKKEAPNWLKTVGYGVLGLVGVLVIVYFVNAQSGWGFTSGLRNLIAGNSLLNKIFNTNYYSRAFKEALDGCLMPSKWLGFIVNPYVDTSLPSNSFLFDNIMVTGTIGSIAFMVFLFFVIRNYIRYYKESGDNLAEKNLILAFISIFFIYSLTSLSIQPYKNYSNYITMSQNPVFLLVLFFIGYIFTDYKKVKIVEKEEKVVEDIKDVEIKEINKEEAHLDV